MKRHFLGKTDVSFSALTLGTVKFGRNQAVKYPTAFDLPSMHNLSELLDFAKAAGITSLDTAPAYGLAEERVGNLLKTTRQSWEIITKAGETYDAKTNSSHYDFNPKSLRKSLENSLKTLQTDYVDCWMLHSDGNDTAHLTDDVIDVFVRAREAGLTRSIGMSTKTVDGGKRALQHLDCIMMAASLTHTDENVLFDIARQQGKGLFLKKIYDSGWALNAASNTAVNNTADKTQVMQKTLQRLFQHKAVCSAIIGTINPEHLSENVQAFNAAFHEQSE